MSQWLVIVLLAITAIIVNVSSGGGADIAIAIITMTVLVGSAILMELQR